MPKRVIDILLTKQTREQVGKWAGLVIAVLNEVFDKPGEK